MINPIDHQATCICYVLCGLLLPCLSGCQSAQIRHGYCVNSVSIIEGFGLGDTSIEAAHNAWDDALERAGHLGYDSFDVEELKRITLPHYFSADRPDGKSVRLELKITGRTVIQPIVIESAELIDQSHRKQLSDETVRPEH